MISFKDLRNQIIPLEEFSLHWRFTDPQYKALPPEHLSQIKPLDKEGARFLWDFIAQVGLHRDVPFQKDFFAVVDKAKIQPGNEKEIKKWLYQRGLPFQKEVYLSWQPREAMIVPWKLLVKYYDDFYYSISDDLSVFDQSLNWALLFYHEDELYFGSNEKFSPSDKFDDIDFIW